MTIEKLIKTMKIFFCFLILFLLTTFKSFAQDDEKPNPNVQEIIFVFKTHFDNGYTDFAESVINKYSTSMMEEALATLEKSRSMPREKQFVWTMPAWPVEQILKRCTPAMKPKIEEAIREGWFVYHALPFTFETEAGDPEELVRSLVFSSELSKKFNLPLPRDAKMTDVPSHSWFLPTLLSKAGIKILHLGCNAASSSPEVPLIFWWKGPDGSKLMTMYWGKYYGTSLVPPQEWKFKTWLAIVHTNDNQGPPTPQEVEETLRRARELAPNARLRIGRISDFYDALIKEDPDLPVISGDMPDTWIHGYMSMPREIKSTRSLQKEIYSFEMLNSLCNIWSEKKTDISAFTAPATENILLFEEHTFGLAMSHGQSGYWCYGDEFRNLRADGIFKPIEDSWKEKGDRVYQAEKVILPAYDRELKRLSGMVNVEGERVVVYNPLPWSRSGLVTIQQMTGAKALKDLRTGEIIPASNSGNVLRFIAENIPSLGYSTYIPLMNPVKDHDDLLKADKINHIIENEYFSVRIDPENGNLVSVRNKKTGTEMVQQGKESGFGQNIYERFSKKNVADYVDQYVKVRYDWAVNEIGRPNLDDSPYKMIAGGKADVSYFTDPVSVKAVIHFNKGNGNPHDYSISVLLYKKLPFIELNWFIDGKPADPWPEAGWISFPFNVEEPLFRIGRLGAVADPAKDFVKGSNFDYFFVNTGLAILDKNMNGFGICSPGAPGISIDRPGLWKYSGNFIPQKPNVFVNLYNNQWSTNFTEWIEGSWSARIYLWSIQDYENSVSLTAPSEEFRSPLKGMLVNGKAGKLPFSRQGISLSERGIVVTAFGSDPFGYGTILRLWENAGVSHIVSIVLPEDAHFTQAYPCNLRSEKTGKAFALKNNVFEIVIDPWAPASFLLE
jgi:hypothetical protein